MPYTAITPFRTAVQRIVENPQPRQPLPDLTRIPGESAGALLVRRQDSRTATEPRYQGAVATHPNGNPQTDPYTIAEFTYDGPRVVVWHGTVKPLDYQGGDANNPEATFGPDKEFISVTELPDGVQGNYLSGRPRGRLEVTEQIDLWHPWRVAVDDLADYICHRLDGRSIQLLDGNRDIAPGIGTIRVGVRSVVQEAGSRMWRLSQRFSVSGHD